MSILTAQCTLVPIGILEIEGMMREDGVFGVAVPQMGSLFPYFYDDQSKTSQKLKRLMGKGFKTHKVKSEFNRNATLFVELDEFLAVIKKLAKEGDPTAHDMIDALLGLSLHQLFSDAFGLRFEKEDRQKYLVERQTHRKRFHPLLTKWLKEDGVTTTYGTEVNRFKLACGLPLYCVDTYSIELLSKMNIAEASYNSLRIAGLSHTKALEILSLSK